MEPKYFAAPEAWRAWLSKNHKTAQELVVGFYKTGSGKPSITWPESVDEALCFGWIDGIRRRIDDERYSIRFTPRRARSIWSAVNIKRVSELADEGRMRPAGLSVFDARDEKRSAGYSSEARKAARLDAEYERSFRARKRAWAFFERKPPSYRSAAIHWVMSAKRPQTRERRLKALIDACAEGTTPPALTPPGKTP